MTILTDPPVEELRTQESARCAEIAVGLEWKENDATRKSQATPCAHQPEIWLSIIACSKTTEWIARLHIGGYGVVTRHISSGNAAKTEVVRLWRAYVREQAIAAGLNLVGVVPGSPGKPGAVCDCGAAEHNAKIDAALVAVQRARTALTRVQCDRPDAEEEAELIDEAATALDVVLGRAK